MFTIAFMIPYPEMEDIIRAAWDEHNESMAILDPGNSSEFRLIMEVGIYPGAAERLLKYSDVIVVRGGSASMVKQFYPNKYFVELPISGSDLMSSVQKATQQCGELPMAMIGTFNMLYSVGKIIKSMGLDIQVYYVDDVKIETLKAAIDEACRDKKRIILGGINTVMAAQEKGLYGQVIESSRESVWIAISEAKRLCNIVRRESEKNSLFQAVMNSSKEGILAVNRVGQVMAVNTAAIELLGLGDLEEREQPIASLIGDRNLQSLFCSDASFNDEIVKHNKKQLSLSKVAVNVEGSSIGYVTTLQDVTRIIETEGKIRNKMFARRHTARLRFEDIVGESTVLLNAISISKRYSKTNSNILLVGESGTGKELFAQSIHNYSNRKDRPFVAVNCAALPENLLESEFFGYVEGAFTGASRDGKQGMFELAHGGTIFLDEISEIPHRLQGRLLRVIQEKEVMRLGHDRLIPVDVRIICATNRDLFVLVKEGAFREDLYYRLNVLTIRLPPMRERRGDIVILARHFLAQFANENNQPVPELDESAQRLLTSYEWGGNIRELRNICERLTVFNETSVISRENVVSVLEHHAEDAGEPLNDGSLNGAVLEQERATILSALAQTGGNKIQAATLLKISKSTLWRRIKELGLQ